MIDNGTVGDRPNGRNTVRTKLIRWKKRRGLAQSGDSKCQKSWCSIDRGKVKLSVSVFLKWQIHNTISLWQKKNNTQKQGRASPVFLSFFLSLPVFLSFSLVSSCDCIGLNSDCIDPGNPLRTNVISALCLCRRREAGGGGRDPRWDRWGNEESSRHNIHLQFVLDHFTKWRRCTREHDRFLHKTMRNQIHILFLSFSFKLKALLEANRGNLRLVNFQSLSHDWKSHNVIDERSAAKLWVESQCLISSLLKATVTFG